MSVLFMPRNKKVKVVQSEKLSQQFHFMIIIEIMRREKGD